MKSTYKSLMDSILGKAFGKNYADKKSKKNKPKAITPRKPAMQQSICEARFEPEKYGLTPILRISGRSRKAFGNRYMDKIPKHVPKSER